MADNEADGPAYEAEHVHSVYEQIAPHFSSTRYKPWPKVTKFLTSLTPGSVGLDIGCGNGKYLAVNHDIFILASDRSTNLTTIASNKAHHPHDALIADTLALPHPLAAFDFAICIAVLHHLSTPARRVAGVRDILATLRPTRAAASSSSSSGSWVGPGGGRALIFVWALEQKGSRRGWDAGDAQDVMVPWVMGEGGQQGGESGEGGGQSKRTFQRYYHLYREGELEEDIQAAGGQVLEAGYERDNWWAVAVRRE